MGTWMRVLAAAIVALVARTSYAQVPFNGTWGPQEQNFLSGTGGTLTGGVAISGACASMPLGDICCTGNDGTVCGYAVTNTTHDYFTIMAGNASPIGTAAAQTGRALILAGGEGTTSGTAVQANCGVGDVVSLAFADGGVTSTKTCTRDASINDATRFTCGTTNAELATNIAACLATASGVTACAGSGCTTFTPVSGVYYVLPEQSSTEHAQPAYVLSSTGDHSVATNGTQGPVLICAGGTTVSSCMSLSADTNGALRIANSLGNLGSGASAGAYAINGLSSVVPAYLGASGANGTGAGLLTLTSGGYVGWSTSATNSNGTLDVSLSRLGTSTLGVFSGTAQSVSGQVMARDQEVTKTGTYTTVFSDCNITINDATDNAIITLLLAATAGAGCEITLRNTAAATTADVGFAAATNDTICGTVGAVTSTCGATNVWRNTQGTAKKGDYTTIRSDGSTTWWITSGIGVWSN